jgi:hypothetical protein
LVVGQIALSLLLLVCAGLLVSSQQKAQDSYPGFDPSHVFLASFDLKPMGYSRAQGIEFDKQMLVRLKSLPGVQSVTLGDFSPLSYTIHTHRPLAGNARLAHSQNPRVRLASWTEPLS